ncbi:uncharacterized protein LOC131948330 [Physella acuta]|uniref:uncharacterized protein LOC131948330 n=1 Tax=Physella acuta TaxID=109671 RepID=UPI0027DB102F|nr:uncharacterized protein LOC131948330 [Physella acuta]
MCERILLLACFLWMAAKTGAAQELVYVWGPNPIKNKYSLLLTFVTVYPDNDLHIRYLDYKNSRNVLVTHERNLRQNSRTTYTLVEVDGIKEYSHFLLEMETANPFEFVALTELTSKVAIDNFRSIPTIDWSIEYAVMIRTKSNYKTVSVFSLQAQRISIEYQSYADSEGPLFEGYMLKSTQMQQDGIMAKPYVPEDITVFIITYEQNRFVHAAFLTGEQRFGCLLLGSQNDGLFPADIAFVPPPPVKYTFYGRKFKKFGLPYDIIIKILVLKDVSPPNVVKFELFNGTKKEVSSFNYGTVLEFTNLAKIESVIPFQAFAMKTLESYVHVQLDLFSYFKRAHVILNPMKMEILEVNLTLTGTKIALETLTLNDDPLHLKDLTVIHEDDQIYTGYARVSFAPMKISSSQNVSVFVQGGDTEALYYEYSSFGPTTSLDPRKFDINLKEWLTSTTVKTSATARNTQTSTAAGIPTSETTLRTTSPTQSIQVTSSKIGETPPTIYSEFNVVCNPDRYGKDCARVCKCSQKCRMDGTCSNEPCRIGKFGDGCRHDDLTVLAVEASPPELFDADTDTGQILRDTKVELTLKNPTPTNSFTFVFEKGADLSEITANKFDIKVWDEENKEMVALTEEYTVAAEDGSVTVHWERPRVVTKIKVLVSTEQKAMSFHLDGGVLIQPNDERNHTKGQGDTKFPFLNINVGYPTPDPRVATVITDGDRHSTCIEREEVDNVTMIFSVCTLLQRIMIYTPGYGDWKLAVWCYDTEGTEVMNTEVSSSIDRIYQVNVNKNVMKVYIEKLSGSLFMCEIEAFANSHGPLKDTVEERAEMGAFFVAGYSALILICLMFSMLLICVMLSLYMSWRRSTSTANE